MARLFAPVDVGVWHGKVAGAMQRLAKMAVYFAGALVLNISVRADVVLSPKNPYAAIVTRNVFGLNPHQTAETSLKIPPNDIITPNGIMSVFGQLQVLFKVTSAAKVGQPPKETFYVFDEGQKQDGVEVLHIDLAAGQVIFNNHGIVQIIPLPNAPTNGAPILAMGEATTSVVYKPNTTGAIGTGRMPPYFGGGEENAGQGELSPMTPEQQIVMIEAQRAYYKSHNDPRASSLPPTALTPPDAYDQPVETFSDAPTATTQLR